MANVDRRMSPRKEDNQPSTNKHSEWSCMVQSKHWFPQLLIVMRLGEITFSFRLRDLCYRHQEQMTKTKS